MARAASLPSPLYAKRPGRQAGIADIGDPPRQRQTMVRPRLPLADNSGWLKHHPSAGPARGSHKSTSILDLDTAFRTSEDCLRHIFVARFGSNPPCPSCKRPINWYKLTRYQRFASACCGGSTINPMAGTLFEHSKIDLLLWFHAILLFTNSKNGISSHFLERHLGVSAKCAWRMCDRIRTHLALIEGRRKVGGKGKCVYVDEALIRGIRTDGRRGRGRAIVFGMIDDSVVCSMVVRNRSRQTLFPIMREHVDPESLIVTDSYGTYRRMSDYGWKQTTVNHSIGEWKNREGYSQAHIENYWAVLKRSIRGTHLHVGREFLWKYINEFNFRFNRRANMQSAFWDAISIYPKLDESMLSRELAGEEGSIRAEP